MARAARVAGSAVTLQTVQPRRTVEEELAAKIASINQSVSSLQSIASLADIQSEVTALDQQINNLVDMLDDARDRGYIYGKDLDTRVNDLLGNWQDTIARVDEAVAAQSPALYDAIYPLEAAIERVSYSPTAASVASLKRQVDGQLRDARQAEDQIESIYQSARRDAAAVQSELTRIDWMMDNLEEASFGLADGESPVAAVKAEYDIPETRDDPDGILYLTDRRLLFEQKEQKATRKILFVTTEKELVQVVRLETDASNIEDVKASKKGLLGREDHLDVILAGGDVRQAHFHLKGQDCNEWARLIKDVMTGDIARDRATGAGLSMRDLTGPITQADILEVQAEANQLQARATLSFAKDAVEDMETRVGNLERDLKDVRARGYLFESDLEDHVVSLVAQWERVKQNVNAEIASQEDKLGATMQEVQSKLSVAVGRSATPERARAEVLGLRSLLATAGSQAEAAEAAVLGQYDDFEDEVDTLSARFEWIDWLLEALSQASFRLYPTEGGVAACQARWVRSAGAQTGVLFLTDQRLIFEEHEGEFSVMIDALISEVEDVDGLEKQGETLDEEHLIVRFGPGAPVNRALFVLQGPTAEEWQVLIGRARQGDFVDDRAEAIDPAELERLKNAPTRCPACGSAFTEPLLRGQTEITCAFCGTVTRV